MWAYMGQVKCSRLIVFFPLCPSFLSICCCRGNQSYSSPFAESGKGGCSLTGVILSESLGGISNSFTKQLKTYGATFSFQDQISEITL